MNRKRFAYAIKETILAVAVIHLVLLIFYAVWHGRYELLNVANILDLQLFFRSLPNDLTVGIITLVPVVILLWINWRRAE